MLEVTQNLNFATMLNVYRSGFTRIPVFKGNRKNVVGVLYAKDLILVDPEDEIEVSTILSFRDHHGYVDENCTLDKALQTFLTSGNHMLLVHRTKTSEYLIGPKRIPSSSEPPDTITIGNGSIELVDKSATIINVQSKHSPDRFKEMGEVIGIITLEDILEEL